MLLTNLAEIILVLFFFFMFCWVFYNLPPLLVGVWQLRRKEANHRQDKDVKPGNFPFFSLIVPMKNEEKVAGRVLNALMKLNYPCDMYEVIVVDDASFDNTSEICKQFESAYPGKMRYFRRDVAYGKPSALNYGLKFAKGEIIGVFDADNVPEPNVLLKAAGYFKEQDIVAIQGLLSSINADESMLARLIYYEGMIQHYALLSGKDKLGLFVPLAGTCQFVRRKVLEEVGGWLDGALSEDMELSARLTEKGYCVKFASDVRSWQENPSSFRVLMGQRTRWFRGCIEVAVKYGKLLKRLDRKSLDAEFFFAGPFVMVLVLLAYILGLQTIFVPIRFGMYVNMLAQFTSVLTLFSLFLFGVGLAYATRPRKISNVKWLPFIYLYWLIQIFVASYAFLQFLFRRPRKWKKTPRTGAVTDAKLAEFLYSSSNSEHSTSL